MKLTVMEQTGSFAKYKGDVTSFHIASVFLGDFRRIYKSDAGRINHAPSDH